MKNLILLFVLLPALSYAQLENKIDSLQRVVASNISDSIKVSAYGDLLDYYVVHDLENAQSELQKFADYSKGKDCPNCEALLLYFRGQIAYQKNENQTAIAYFNKAANKSWGNSNYRLFQKSAAMHVQLLLLVQQYDKAEKELALYLQKAQTSKDISALYEIYFLYGNLNYDRGFLDSAIENYQKADELFLKSNNAKQLERVRFKNGISKIYQKRQDYDNAMEFAQQAFLIAQKTKDSLTIMSALLHKGVIATEFKHYKQALVPLDKSFLYFNRVSNADNKGTSALYLGMSYYGLGEHKSAAYFLTQAKGTFEQNGDQVQLAKTMAYLGRVYLAISNFKAARYCIDQSKMLMKEDTEEKAYIDLLGLEISFFEATGDYKSALRVMRQQNQLQKAHDAKANEDHLNEVQTRVQSGHKVTGTQVFSAEAQMTERQKMAQIFIFLSVLLLLIVAGFMIYAANRNRHKLKQKMSELSAMKSILFANISNEFRAVITISNDALKTVRANYLGQEYKNELDSIDKNTQHSLELTNQLLELSRIEAGGLKLIFKVAALDEFLHDIIKPFEAKANTLKLSFITNIEKTGQQIFDQEAVAQIVSNLLASAFNHNVQEQPIYFSATIEKSHLNMRFSNSTSEFKKAAVAQPLERMHHQSDGQSTSFIALALVKEIVDRYAGSIDAQVEKNELRFVVRLPLDKECAADVDVQHSSETTVATAPVLDVAKELPKLLIIEAHAEIRNMLKQQFGDQYKLLIAKNSEQALKIVKIEIPDCIISNVDMPKMDGLAFAYALKNDELTSAIPLLLLTTELSEANESTLQHAADAFLTKPIRPDDFKKAVDELVARRNNLQEQYN